MEVALSKKDDRRLTKKKKYAYRSNTIRNNFCAYTHCPKDLLNCPRCKGVCIHSNYNPIIPSDTPALQRYHPKYHSTATYQLKRAGLLPEEGEVFRAADEFRQVAEEEKQKKTIILELGYDPDSIKYLPSSLKAKQKKRHRREQSSYLYNEKWSEKPFTGRDFLDALNLMADKEVLEHNVAQIKERVNKVGCYDHQHQYLHTNVKRGRFCFDRNQLKGTFKKKRRGSLDYMDRADLAYKNKKPQRLLEFQLNDPVLVRNEHIASDLLVKELIGAQ